jgi:outer membrane lipoprotein-sorting protein
MVSALLLLNGCATTPKPQLIYQPGAVVETLSSTASFSISKGDQGMGSSGYLLYQRPDRIRVVILSPFGSTVMEAIMIGTQITIVNTSKGVAFSGNIEELPHKGEGETWRQARWVMDTDQPGSSVRDGSVNRVNSLGYKEVVTFANGLVVSKSLVNGDMVRYGEYELVNGVPLATEIIMDSHDGGRFRIKMSEPEVNTALAAEAFLPKLDGLRIFPLAALQEP